MRNKFPSGRHHDNATNQERALITEAHLSLNSGEVNTVTWLRKCLKGTRVWIVSLIEIYKKGKLNKFNCKQIVKNFENGNTNTNTKLGEIKKNKGIYRNGHIHFYSIIGQRRWHNDLRNLASTVGHRWLGTRYDFR